MQETCVRVGLGSEYKKPLPNCCIIHSNWLEEVRAKIFHSIDFLKIFTTDNELNVSEMQKKNIGGHRLRFRYKRVENYPDFDKLAHVIQHGLQGFILS